jgi:hypothetical protein
MITYNVTNAATVYRIHVITLPQAQLVCAETGWSQGHGEWVMLLDDSVAWTYLTEKMPSLARHEGDKPGWIMAFAKARIEVFG